MRLPEVPVGGFMSPGGGNKGSVSGRCARRVPTGETHSYVRDALQNVHLACTWNRRGSGGGPLSRPSDRPFSNCAAPVK